MLVNSGTLVHIDRRIHATFEFRDKLVGSEYVVLRGKLLQTHISATEA